MVLAILAGFAFAKIRSRATPVIYGSFVLGILLSIQSLMVPIFIEVTQLDRLLGSLLQCLRLVESADSFHLFYNSRVGVLLIYIGSGLPVALYMSTAYVRGIPDALVEAARIDGAGYFRIFRGIILPMCVPIATTVAILNITGIWNEFALINILVSKTELKSIPLGVYRFTGTMMADYGKQFAALVIGMAPMLIFYLVFRTPDHEGRLGRRGEGLNPTPSPAPRPRGFPREAAAPRGPARAGRRPPCPRAIRWPRAVRGSGRRRRGTRASR